MGGVFRMINNYSDGKWVPAGARDVLENIKTEQLTRLDLNKGRD